jgi:putative hydrolase of the HAD superfamily
MAGNSLRSDVVPALRAGAWGVHVPHEHEWSMEAADEPSAEPRYRRIGDLGQLVRLVQEIG